MGKEDGKLPREPGWRAQNMRDLIASPGFKETWLAGIAESAKVKRAGLPLLLRGARVEEVIGVTGWTQRQTESLVGGLRRQGILLRPTKDEERFRKKRAHLGKPKSSHGREYTAEQKKAFVLAKKFLDAGFIGKDTFFWQSLHEMYARQERKLPEDFADKLRLEVFLVARTQVEDGNKKLLNNYIRLGSEVDYDWFGSSLIEEQRFITDTVRKNRERLIREQMRGAN